MMNRETSFHTSDTLVVRDRSSQRRWVIIGAVIALVAIAAALIMFMGAGGDKKAADAGGAGAGQIPTVTVIVPGRSQVGRTIGASGPLAAKRDQPVGIAGSG